MHTWFRSIVLLVCCLIMIHASGQRVLLVERPGSFKNFKYFEGSDIIIRTLSDGAKVEGNIHMITDTSIVIDYDKEIMLLDIKKIIRPLFWTNLLTHASRIAGVGYFALDVVNNSINNEVMIDEQTLKISAGLLAFSYALVPLHHRRLKIGKPWRIKVLNFSMDNEPLNPFLR